MKGHDSCHYLCPWLTHAENTIVPGVISVGSDRANHHNDDGCTRSCLSIKAFVPTHHDLPSLPSISFLCRSFAFLSLFLSLFLSISAWCPAWCFLFQSATHQTPDASSKPRSSQQMAEESWFRREFLTPRRLVFNILFYGLHFFFFGYGWYTQVCGCPPQLPLLKLTEKNSIPMLASLVSTPSSGLSGLLVAPALFSLSTEG